MAETKGDLKAQLEETERRTGSRLTVGLSAIAGGLAVALLIASIGGGLYIQNLEKKISEQECNVEEYHESSGGDTYHITYDNGETKEDEDITVDKDTETEMFIKKDKQGHISSVAIADFKRGLLSMYIPKLEECYIASGVHEWMANATTSIKDYQKHNGETVQAQPTDDTTVNFVKASETPVTDHSILPTAIKPYCAGKPLFWIHKGKPDMNTDVAEGSRKKRSICYDYTCYYYYYYGQLYYYCYWYYYYC